MKKQRIVSVVMLVLCTAMLFLLSACSAPQGDTIESREALLNESIKEGKEWTIEKEITINNNIISAARGADDMTTLAIFRPTFEGGYAFSRSVIFPSYLIMITSAEIGQKNYDLFWVSDPKAVTLEITYTIDGEKQEPIIYDVSNRDIIAIPQEGKELHVTACYYDSEGNRCTYQDQ